MESGWVSPESLARQPGSPLPPRGVEWPPQLSNRFGHATPPVRSGKQTITMSGAVTRGLIGLFFLLALPGAMACARAGPSSGPTPVPQPPEISELPGRGVAIQGHGTA